MKVELQNEKEVVLNLVQEGTLNEDDVVRLQSVESLLPFQIDHSTENRVRYHVSPYISMIEYLNAKVLEFDEVKALFLQCADGFLEIQKAGGKIANILYDLNQVYIEPVTQELRYIYIPVMIEIQPAAFTEFMKNIMFFLQSENAELLLGNAVQVLGRFPDRDRELEVFREHIVGITNNVLVVEKQIQVDRVVEKVIEKPMKQRSDLGGNLLFFTIVYTFFMILLPVVLVNYLDKNIVSEPKLLNVTFCLFAILFTMFFSVKNERKRMDNKMVVTLQPQEKK